MSENPVEQDRVERYYKKLKKNAEKSGYHLNADEDFTKELLESILVNKDRYGYESCPCRLASGNISDDQDIICPCDYRDPDLNDFGACYCGLYVSSDILSGEKELTPIPERRPSLDNRLKSLESDINRFEDMKSSLNFPVWRCRVCGYLCAREKPPEVCPICKVSQDRFSRFM